MIILQLIRFLLLSAVFSLVLTSERAGAATDAEAKAIVDAYSEAYGKWLTEMKLARDGQALEMVNKKRPDASVYASKLKTLLRSDLDNEWTLKYGAWLLENDTALRPESQRALLGAVERHHVKSSLLGPFCMAMINLNQGGELPRAGTLPLGSRGMKLLETIKKTNPDPKVQGQAALALSILLGRLGDDGAIMRQRMTNLKEAIINSTEIKVGATKVGDIVRDELYKISHLTKGRVAPDITGLDSASRPLSLKQYRGKVVMLVFWSSWDAEAPKILELLRKTVASKVGKPFVVLGVNRDSLTNLRALEADQIVTWRNFSDPKQEIAKSYRLAAWPYCLILDQEGVIAYRGSLGAICTVVANDLLSAKTTVPSSNKSER